MRLFEFTVEQFHSIGGGCVREIEDALNNIEGLTPTRILCSVSRRIELDRAIVDSIAACNSYVFSYGNLSQYGYVISGYRDRHSGNVLPIVVSLDVTGLAIEADDGAEEPAYEPLVEQPLGGRRIVLEK